MAQQARKTVPVLYLRCRWGRIKRLKGHLECFISKFISQQFYTISTLLDFVEVLKVVFKISFHYINVLKQRIVSVL